MVSPEDRTSPVPNTQSIQDEHDQLRALLEELSGADLTGAIPLLGQLRELLVTHFKNEEGEDGFEAIAQRQPQFLPKLEEIFNEHQEFLHQVDALIEKAQSAAKQRQDVLQGIASLAHQLHEHEEKENTLLSDIMYTDLGGHN